MLTLEVNTRDSKESAETLRKRGAVPAVFYGPKEQSTAIAIDARKLAAIWKQAGETTIITLKGAGSEKDTLIHDVQFHPVTGALLHADFYVLEKGKKISIKVPLVFSGTAPAEKAGHIVVKAMHEIEIEVIPQELPHNLPVELATLENIGDRIVAAEIKLPPSAVLITHGDDIVASVTEFKEEKIEEPVAPVIEGAEGAEAAAPVERAETAASAPEAEARPEAK